MLQKKKYFLNTFILYITFLLLISLKISTNFNIENYYDLQSKGWSIEFLK